MMRRRKPRFEVVQSDAGWFARFRAANGRIVFSSEVYKRQESASEAIALILSTCAMYQTALGDAALRDERTAVTS